MDLVVGLQLVAPDDLVAVGGDDVVDALDGGNLELLVVQRVIAEVPAREVDVLGRAVVEFNPILLFPEVVDVDVVCGADLVDAHALSSIMGWVGSGSFVNGG